MLHLVAERLLSGQRQVVGVVRLERLIKDTKIAVAALNNPNVAWKESQNVSGVADGMLKSNDLLNSPYTLVFILHSVPSNLPLRYL